MLLGRRPRSSGLLPSSPRLVKGLGQLVVTCGVRQVLRLPRQRCRSLGPSVLLWSPPVLVGSPFSLPPLGRVFAVCARLGRPDTWHPCFIVAQSFLGAVCVAVDRSLPVFVQVDIIIAAVGRCCFSRCPSAFGPPPRPPPFVGGS